jgi:rSAM/selenodomain-associated transferase 2
VTAISVIIPVLNEERIIEDALSRLAGIDGDFEVIVVDNGSTDGTLRLASRWANTLTSAPGRGPARNAGAAAAVGDVLLFLHADTHLPDGAVDAVRAALSDEKTVGGCFSVSFGGDDWRDRLVTLLYGLFSRLGFFYGDAAIFVRHDTFRALGGYKPMALMEDLDLCIRLREAGGTTRLPLSVHSSTRRWRRQGFLKTMLVFLVVQGLYLVGYRRPSLFKLYRAIR